MLTTHPPMRSPRPSPKPSSKVPIMSLTKSSTPSVPPPTSSPSHWPSSEFAERFSYCGQFHSQLSVPCVIPSNSPHIRSRSCFVADIVVPPSFHLLGTADIHNTYPTPSRPLVRPPVPSLNPAALMVSLVPLAWVSKNSFHPDFNGFWVYTMLFVDAIAATVCWGAITPPWSSLRFVCGLFISLNSY